MVTKTADQLEKERAEEERLARERAGQSKSPGMSEFLSFIFSFIKALFDNSFPPPDFEDAPNEEARAAARAAYESRMRNNPPDKVESRFAMTARMLSYEERWNNLKQSHEGTLPIPILPVADEARFTSAFGKRTDPVTGRVGSQHNGIDLAPEKPGDTKAPIISAMPGVVIQVVPERNSGGFGNLVRVAGIDGRIYEYAHLANFAVKEGEVVQQGNRIGIMGSTGKSTGVHLHYGIMERDAKGNFSYVNPDISGQVFSAADVGKKQFAAGRETAKQAVEVASQNVTTVGEPASGLPANLNASRGNSPFRTA